MKHYILKNKKVVEAELLVWAKWFENSDNRIIDKTTIGKVKVSTVFLGIALNELFETMIFGGKHDQYQERHRTWKQAKEGHKIAVDLVKEDK